MDTIPLAYILTAVLLGLYLYSKWNHSYWKRKGLYTVQPEFFYGNVKGIVKNTLSLGDQFTEIYKDIKSTGNKHGGYYVFFTPVYMPVDLDLVKCILQKDFNNFVNHGLYFNEEVDPLSGHLFNLEDEKWKKLRAKLTPTFTSGKMKMMFQTLVSCSFGLDAIFRDYAKIRDPLDVKEIVSRFTTDVIGSCAFGIECDSLKNPQSEFRKSGRKIFHDQSTVKRLKTLLNLMLPKSILRFFRFKTTDAEVAKFFMDAVNDTVKYREKNNIYRKDFMHLLLQLKNRGELTDDESVIKADGKPKPGESLTFNELAAQCFVFFLAGFETSATTMTFALLELALNQDIQERLREEIKLVLSKHDGQVTYEAMMEMTYLDQILYETLRRHPPFAALPRICNKAYRVPNTNVIIEPGTRVHIRVQAIQRDPDYYPDPEKFDPDRFDEENKANRHTFSFLPFGKGPRICIGARFGLLQAKVGITAILGRFRVTLNKKTRIPIKYTTIEFVTSVVGGVWLDVAELENHQKLDGK